MAQASTPSKCLEALALNKDSASAIEPFWVKIFALALCQR